MEQFMSYFYGNSEQSENEELSPDKKEHIKMFNLLFLNFLEYMKTQLPHEKNIDSLYTLASLSKRMNTNMIINEYYSFSKKYKHDIHHKNHKFMKNIDPKFKITKYLDLNKLYHELEKEHQDKLWEYLNSLHKICVVIHNE